MLAAAHRRHPGDPELLGALATISREAGRLGVARDWAARLSALPPAESRPAKSFWRQTSGVKIALATVFEGKCGGFDEVVPRASEIRCSTPAP